MKSFRLQKNGTKEVSLSSTTRVTTSASRVAPTRTRTRTTTQIRRKRFADFGAGILEGGGLRMSFGGNTSSSTNLFAHLEDCDSDEAIDQQLAALTLQVNKPPKRTPRKVKDPLVWIDLEMTGLDLEVHTIIEIACLVTDGELTQKHIVSIETFSLSLSLSLPVSLSILFSNAIVGNV